MSAQMKMCLLGLLVVFLSTGSAHAQFNDSINHYMYVASTGTFSKTNDLNSYVLANNVKFAISKKRLSFNTANSWVYGKQSDVKSNDDFSSLVEFDFLKKQKRLYIWGNGTFDKSYSLKIDYRYQAGTGIGFNIAQQPNLVLNVTEGAIYETGSVIDNELGERRYNIWRNSTRFKYRWVMKDLVILDGFVLYQPSISTRNDVIFKTSTTLSIKVRKWLSLSSAFTYNEITLTDRRNLIVTYGVVMERFF